MGRNCKKKEVHCGTILSSHCVDYTGQDLKSLDKGVDQCSQSVTDVIENIDTELKKIKDGIDVKKLTRLCIDSIDKEDSFVIVVNKLIKVICDLKEEVEELKTNTQNIDVLAQVISLDSSCLSDAHCGTDSTLRTLLIKIIAELCFVKAQVSNSSNSTNIYQP